MTESARRITSAAIFLGFVVFVEWYFGWATLLAPWRDMPWTSMFLAVGLVFVSYALRALRLYDYFRADMRGGFGACLRLMLMHNLLNNMLPMRTGELSFPLLMNRYFDISAVRSVPALLWFRALDLHSLLALALALLGERWLGKQGAVFALVVWVPLPWLLFTLAHWLRARLAPHAEHRVYAWVLRLLHGLPAAHSELLRSWLWTIVNWGMKLAVFAWVMQQFIDISTPLALLGAVAGDATSVLPVHGVAGAGTYEAGVVAVLLPFGIASQQALAAAVNLHVFILGSTVVGGLIALALPRRARQY